ncbi:hypothetical protein KHP62_11930 [Rhodobacteraceae bacterium NNCM2]|nr:hypothetical protein [Coraliihabitans acroporae]
MPGKVRIWWHRGVLRDENYNVAPIADEPEISVESITLDGTVQNSGAAPVDARLALVQSDTDIAYVVRLPGQSVAADPALHKPLAATGLDLHAISIPEGASLSMVELV